MAVAIIKKFAAQVSQGFDAEGNCVFREVHPMRMASPPQYYDAAGVDMVEPTHVIDSESVLQRIKETDKNAGDTYAMTALKAMIRCFFGERDLSSVRDDSPEYDTLQLCIDAMQCAGRDFDAVRYGEVDDSAVVVIEVDVKEVHDATYKVEVPRGARKDAIIAAVNDQMACSGPESTEYNRTLEPEDWTFRKRDGGFFTPEEER